MTISPVGLIGVGLLGTALAERMQAGGFHVLGFDLDPDRLRTVEAAQSAQEVAERCQAIVLCLPDSKIVAAAVEPLLAQLRTGSVLVDATTGDPEDVVRLASNLASHGVGYVDATIAGSSEQVRQGSAVVMLGGESGAVALAEPVLRTWSDRRFHAGPSGSGARLKLVVNLVLGLHRAVLAEGLTLARSCGIDLASTLEVLQATPAYSAAMDTKGPKMIAGDYTPQARLAQHWKDVRLIRELARRNGAATPLSDIHEELLAKAVELGLGAADNSAVFEVYSRLGRA